MALDFSFKSQFPIAQMVQAMQQKAVQQQQMDLAAQQAKRDQMNQLLNTLTTGASLARNIQGIKSDALANQMAQLQIQKAQREQVGQQGVMDFLNRPQQSAAVTSPIQQFIPGKLAAPGMSDTEPLGPQLPPPMPSGKFSQPTFGQTAQFNPDTGSIIPNTEPNLQAQFQKNLFASDPSAVIKQMAEKMYSEKTDKPSFEFKDVMVDGQPTKAISMGGSPQLFDANTMKPITGQITPYSPNAASPLTDADRTRLKPLAKSIIEGRATPQQLVAARGAEREKLSLVTAELDPNFDLSLAPQRIATRKDFSSAGKTGTTLTSINTALGHLDSMYENGKNLNNTDLLLWNKVKNTATRQTGSAAVDRMLADRDAVTSELGRVFQTTGVVTQSERDEFRARLNEASSPEQIKAVSDEWINLLKSRTDSIKSNWDQSMGGVETPVPILNTKTKKILTKHGFDPVTMEKTGIGGIGTGWTDLGGGFKVRQK